MFTYEVDEEISLKLIDEGDAEAVFKLNRSKSRLLTRMASMVGYDD